MTGSAKQSSFFNNKEKESWIASSFALRATADAVVTSAPLRKRFAFVAGNDGQKQIRPRDAKRPRFAYPTLSHPRAQGMPGARCARSRVCGVGSKHTR
jgi:hypothetical protein